MRNKDYYKRLVHRICRAFFCWLEIAVIAAIPVFAILWSGRYAERVQLLEAAVESLERLGSEAVNMETKEEESGDYVAAESSSAKAVLKFNVEVEGIVNTGSSPGFQEFVEDNSYINSESEEAVFEAFAKSEYVSEEYTDKLLSMALDSEEIKEILENAADYPKELLEMLAKYPETLEFVYDYPEKKDLPAATTVGTVIEDEIPLLLQWDERWGYVPYGDCLIANSGCGPTCLSMVIVGLTGNTEVTPKVVADYADENGYYEPGAGSKWTLMTEGVKHFGVCGTELALNESVIYETLNSGKPIICSMGPGDFTTNGHFIVLTKIVNGKIQLNDPNSCGNSGKLWSYDELEWQIYNLWSFEIP